MQNTSYQQPAVKINVGLIITRTQKSFTISVVSDMVWNCSSRNENVDKFTVLERCMNSFGMSDILEVVMEVVDDLFGKVGGVIFVDDLFYKIKCNIKEQIIKKVNGLGVSTSCIMEVLPIGDRYTDVVNCEYTA